MPGILCFRNYMIDPNNSPSISDQSGSGSADTAHPAAHAIDNRADTYFRRTGGNSCTLRMTFGLSQSMGLCVVSAVGVESLISSGTVRANVTVRCKVGTSAGGTDIYDGYRRIKPPNSGVYNDGSPANAVFVINTLPETPQGIKDRAIGGGFYGVGSIYVDLIFSNGGTNADWRIREVGAWGGLAGRVKPTRSFSGQDLGEVQRSEAGAEFVRNKGKKRTLSATFTNLEDRAVFGGALGPIPSGLANDLQVTASVAAVNYYAGVTTPVIFVPHSDIGTSGYTTPFDSVGRNWDVDNRAQSEIMWGYLTGPLQANELALYKDGAEIGSIWEASFSMIDGFNGVV